jgi:Carboxypeptidase regulatory-like domain
MALQVRSALLFIVLGALASALSASGQTSQPTPASSPKPQTISGSADPKPSSQPMAGIISGTVIDRSGAVVAEAKVELARGDHSAAQEVLSGTNGEFSFADVVPGAFQITVSADGFEPQASSGILHSGETRIVPPIVLALATVNTFVQAAVSPAEVAQEQVREEEKQRMLGVIPNFYVSYTPDAVALDAKQKFELAWKTTLDPFIFGVVGVVAGVQQAQNDFRGYGQGAQGYAKRYGASYADVVAGTFIGSAILPSVLKQDPRYFYKGSGRRRSRFLYALANSVICKGDNGRWQPSYSNIVGNLAAGGISNLYYPAKDRNGARLTFENGLIGIGTTGAANLFEEFVVRRHAPASGGEVQLSNEK